MVPWRHRLTAAVRRGAARYAVQVQSSGQSRQPLTGVGRHRLGLGRRQLAGVHGCHLAGAGQNFPADAGRDHWSRDHWVPDHWDEVRDQHSLARLRDGAPHKRGLPACARHYGGLGEAPEVRNPGLQNRVSQNRVSQNRETWAREGGRAAAQMRPPDG